MLYSVRAPASGTSERCRQYEPCLTPRREVLSTEKGRGSLREDLFLKIVGQYLPLSTDDQSRMVLLCPKNLLGEVRRAL